MILAWCWIIQRWICSCFISVGPSCQHWLDYCQSIVLQSSEPLEMFNREVVSCLFFVMYSARGLWRTCTLHLATATERGVLLSYTELTQQLAQFFFFFLLLRVTLVPPTFIFNRCDPFWAASEALLVSPVLLCLLLDREWAMAGWQLAPLLSPVISSGLLYCVSLPPRQPLWTLTGYSGLKFQHPSVKPNKHYLKGQQKPGEKHR